MAAANRTLFLTLSLVLIASLCITDFFSQTPALSIQAQSAGEKEADAEAEAKHERDAGLALCEDLSPWLYHDRDAICDNALLALEQAPASPATRWLVSEAEDSFYESSRELELFDALIDSIGWTREYQGHAPLEWGNDASHLLSLLARVSERPGENKVRMASLKLLSGLRGWLVAGPFQPHGEDTFGELLPPELLVQFDAPMRGAAWDVEWREYLSSSPLEDSPDGAALSANRGSGYFFATAITNPSAQRVLLRVRDVVGGVRVWLAGKEVMHRTPWQRDVYEIECEAMLPAGESLLMVKLGSDSNFRADILNPANHLALESVSSSAPDREAMQPFVLESKPIEGGDNPLTDPSPFDRRRLPLYPQTLGAGEGDAASFDWLRAAINAAVYRERGYEELAEDYTRAFMQSAPQNSDAARIWRLYLLNQGTGVITRAQHAALMRDQIEALVSDHPEAIELLFAQVDVLYTQDQFEQVVRLLERITALDPHWSTLQRASIYYQRMGWVVDARDTIELAWRSVEEENPPLTLLLSRARTLQERSDYEGARALLNSPAAMRASSSFALISLGLDISQRLGDRHSARSFLQLLEAREGGQTRWVRSTRAQHADWLGEWQSGYDELFALAKSSPGYAAGFLRRASNMATAHSDDRRAIAALNALLEVDPSSLDDERMLAELNSYPFSMLPAEASDPAELDPSSMQASDFPLASGGVLLDEAVVTINRDASYRDCVSRSIKVFTQAGVDRFGSEDVGGDLISVFTQSPDGKRHEPVSYAGGSVQFPRVTPGSLLHYTTTNNFPKPDSERFEEYTFIFGEGDSRIPTALARLVIITPPGLRLDFFQHDIRAGEYRVTQRDDGYSIHTWEVKRPTSSEDEAYGPNLYETRPWVQFSPRTSAWNSQAASALDSLEVFKPTWLVRKQSTEILWNALSQDAMLADRWNEERGEFPALGATAYWPTPIAIPSQHGGKALNVEHLPSTSYTHFARAAAFTLGAERSARLLYDWINESIPDESQGDGPHSTLQLRSGDRSDLFAAMLTACGLRFDRVFTGEREQWEAPHQAFDRSWSYRKSSIVALHTEAGETIYITCDDRLAPFASYSHDSSDLPAMTINPRSGEAHHFRLPKLDRSCFGEAFSATIKLDASGDAQVQGAYTLRGYDGWYSKESSLREREEERTRSLASELNYMFSGLELESMQIESNDEARGSSADAHALPGDRSGFRRSFAGSVASAASNRGDDLELPLLFCKLDEYTGSMGERETRKWDLINRGSLSLDDRVVVEIPDGFAIAELPESLDLPGDLLNYHLSFQREGQSIVITRSVELRPGRVSPAAYPAFRKRLLSIVALEDEVIRLRKLR